MKILIVEDEAKTCDYLKQGLSEAGFTADLLRNGLDGMRSDARHRIRHPPAGGPRGISRETIAMMSARQLGGGKWHCSAPD
jgi:hypothetical protein